MPYIFKRKGGEILVNTETSAGQSAPSMAVLQGGGYIVVWTDSSTIGVDNSVTAIKAQRFDADGLKVGGEFLVNTTVTAAQGAATVATLPSGRFVVTWTDLSATGGDTNFAAVRGQLFEANGTPVGGEFLINTNTTGNQQFSVVTELAAGGFVVSWSDGTGDDSGTGVKAQLFDASGAKVGAEFLVNSVTLGAQHTPSITPLANGGFVIAWNGTAGSSGGQNFGSVKYQVFDAAGAKVGSEGMANASTLGNFSNANVAVVGSGFVVTWAHSLSATDPDGLEIVAQRFDAAGAKIGAEFTVNSTTLGDQRTVDVDELPGGAFIVTWQGPGEAGTGTNIYGQVYDSGGNKVGVEFILSGTTAGEQLSAKVEVLPSGDLVVTYADNSGVGGDSSGFAVKTQFLTLAGANDAPTDIAISNSVVSETQIDNIAVATLSATGALNTTFTYEIVSDSSNGGFGIEGDRLIVADNLHLDFETQPSVEVRIRATDLLGNSYEETLTLNIADAAIESRYSAGGVFSVVTNPAGFNDPSSITALAGGNFLIVQSFFEPGRSSGTLGRIYDSAGMPVTDEFVIDLDNINRTGLVVGALPSGGFVIAYEGASIQVGNGNAFPIRMQKFDATGHEVGPDMLVSATNSGNLHDPSVAVLNSGKFVITWTLPVDEGSDPGALSPSQIAAQLFDATGAKIGGEFRVNTSVVGNQVFSHADSLPNGGFVVTWQDAGQQSIVAQFYTPSGVRVGGEHTILSGNADVRTTHLSVLSTGQLVVTWTELVDDSGPFNIFQVKAQIVGADGANVGSAIVIDTVLTAGFDVGNDITAIPGGGFVVTWQNLDPTDASGETLLSWAQVYDGSGARVGDAFLVEDRPNASENLAHVAALENGDLVFTWSSAFIEDGAITTDAFARVIAHKFVPPPAIVGTPGADTLTGTADDDIIQGLAGNDHLLGLGGDDQLDGGDGDDLLDGGFGDDILHGGAGHDRILLVGGGAEVVDAGADSDLVEIQLFSGHHQITLGAGADIVLLSEQLFPVGSITLTDFEAGDAGDALSFADYLAIGWPIGTPFTNGQLHLSQQGADAYLTIDFDGIGPGALPETFILFQNVQASSLTAHNLGGFAPDGSTSPGITLVGSAETDFLTGNSGNDLITGNGGDDVLFGSAGDDQIEGGDGNDELFGETGSDSLDGGAGADDLGGGRGNDYYIVDNGGDRTFETVGGGYDIVFTKTSYTLTAGQEIESLGALNPSATAALDLTGNEFTNRIIGNAGVNSLDGGAGADDLFGGAGNDFYVVDNAGDRAFESVGEGYDIVFAKASYVLTAGQEIESLGTLNPNAVTALDLTGNEFANRIIGNAGNNSLDGGAGADDLFGGAGNDFYVVDNAGDRTFESVGEGYDIVFARTSYTLTAGQEIESLGALNPNATGELDLYGNEFANRIIGNAGSNTLDGGAGADDLFAGAGNDFYIVDNAGDRTFEAVGEGYDIVFARSSYTLTAGQEIESLGALNPGATTALDLGGNEFANRIIGNAGANTINGGAGADILFGEGGADSFAFTTALGGDNVDRLADFSHGTDKVALDHGVFTGLGVGALNANAFVTGTAAGDADDRIIYDAATGNIFYDADGNGAGAQVLFATVDPATVLTASDFQVI